MEIVVAPRFNGPPGSGNGGYTAGLVARRAGGPAEVTLRRPPPLGRPLAVAALDDGRIEVRDGEELVAEAAPATLERDVPAAVGFEDAERAAALYPGFEAHAFPTCFVCGPARQPGDGLRVFAGPVAGRDVVAAPWVPDAWLADDYGTVRPEFAWAALDCPGAIAVGHDERGETVLGRMAARVDALPAPGERCVVVAWPAGRDGRKLYAGTALFRAGGELLALARQTWIIPR